MADNVSDGIQVHEYGNGEAPPVVVLHGGPRVAGYMAPVAHGLVDSFWVLKGL